MLKKDLTLKPKRGFLETCCLQVAANMIPSNAIRISVTFFLLALFASLAQAQFHEAFDSMTPTWKRHESDCTINESKWNQRRSNNVAARNRFESLEVQNGPGTQILVSHDVPPSFVISELVPSVRVKADQPGIRLMVRVVLPHTDSPSGDGPMTTMLTGPRYEATGKWQELSLAGGKDLSEKLREEIWLLRRRFDTEVSQRDAYIDKVVLNLYTGPGTTKVQIDDLRLKGMVSAAGIADTVRTTGTVKKDNEVRQTSLNGTVAAPREKQESLVKRDGTVLLVKNKPFFPRIVEHNGEPLDYLKAIGFNTVELKSTATFEQLRQAQKLDLWLICPAPSSVGLSPIDFKFDRVLGWSVGDQLSGRDVPVIEQRIREIRESDQRMGRPVIGGAQSDWSQLAKLTDVLSVGVEPIGTSFIASQYSEWINQRRQATGNGTPVWADIQTELSKSLTAQIGTLAKQSPPIPIEPQQIKFLVYEAITGGARGLRFRSRNRLDAVDPVSRLRAQTIEWVNAEIAQIEPWAVGGAVMGEVTTNDKQIEVTAINTNRSRLLLIQRPTHHEQYLAGDVPTRTISFQDSATNGNKSAYLIDQSGLISLPNSQNHAGVNIQIDNCPFLAAVVLTQDPLVMNKLRSSYERVGKQTIMQMHTELTQQWLAITQLINQQMERMQKSSAEASGALTEANTAFQTAQTLINGSSPQTAVDYLNRTDERLSFVRRDMVTGPLGMFQSKTSTPFVAHASLIPLHWELASRLGTSEWNPNGLAGGDFENLQHMMSNGWENRRLDNEKLITNVELSEAARVDGRYGLKMSVNPRTATPQLIESTPLWISTPEIPIKSGQLLRIHGWVNVPQVIQGTHDGLMVTDSLGGTDMAERIPVTRGWQEFTLYRGAPSDGVLKVTFSLGGVGEALLDEVTIRAIDLPQLTPRQARNQ